MAPKYKETLVDRSYSQQVFMEELRWRVKPPCKAQTKGSVFSCASSPIFGVWFCWFFFLLAQPFKRDLKQWKAKPRVTLWQAVNTK